VINHEHISALFGMVFWDTKKSLISLLSRT